MPKTPNGGTSPYATPTIFLELIDWRIVGDLVRDDGTQATQADLLTDANLAKALEVASGYIESACLAAENYSVADLLVLTGNSLALLQQITAGLAYSVLRRRRGIIEEADIPIAKEAQTLLQDLRDGKRIFAFEETEEAGLPTVQPLNPQTNQPSLVTLNNPIFPVGRCLRGLG